MTKPTAKQAEMLESLADYVRSRGFVANVLGIGVVVSLTSRRVDVNEVKAILIDETKYVVGQVDRTVIVYPVSI